LASPPPKRRGPIQTWTRARSTGVAGSVALFVDDDVRAGVRLPDGTLKTISEAKEVTGELKYQQPFNFVVRTVPILLCNNVPSLADLSQGTSSASGSDTARRRRGFLAPGPGRALRDRDARAASAPRPRYRAR
jgi:hypothetical protein